VHHPIADSISDDDLRLRLTKIRSGIQDRIASMPKHAEYIRQNCESKMSRIVI
jgi:tryptophan halogenase